MWVTGGRSDLHPLYNLESSYKSSDVWYTYDGISIEGYSFYTIYIAAHLYCANCFCQRNTRLRLGTNDDHVRRFLCAKFRRPPAWARRSMVRSCAPNKLYDYNLKVVCNV